MLKYHSDIFTELIDFLNLRNIFSKNHYIAILLLFQFVQTSEQGGFSGTGRSDQANHFALFYIKGDVLQNFQISKYFM